MMCMGMAVGMAACSGVPRGPASSFEAAFAGHHSGLAAVSEGGDAAVRPLPRMNAREALEERLPGGVRLASANAVAAADAPMTIPPLEDDEVLGEYDPWEPFNRQDVRLQPPARSVCPETGGDGMGQGPPRSGAGEPRELLQ